MQFGANQQLFMPEYTMNGLEVHNSTKANGNQYMRALRVILPSQLKFMQASLFHSIRDTTSGIFEDLSNGLQGWKEVNHFDLAKKTITAANSRAFFGEDLSSIPAFLKAALEYPEDLFRTAEVLRLLPKFLAPVVAPFLMRQHRASNTLVGYLKPMIGTRLEQSVDSNDSNEAKPLDCVQFFIDANRKRGAWTIDKIVQAMLGIWFAALHQPALFLTYALEDICRHPEYTDLLRKELSTCDITEEALERLPLLDSFLKESGRLHPSDSVSVRRKVLQPFRFSDGTPLLAGDVACVPLQAIMRDPANYTNGTEFNGYRFVNTQTNTNTTRFVDGSPTYPLWGLGVHAW